MKTSKYSLLTFWAVAPFEQLRRAANLTYLILGIIQAMLEDPPVDPMTTIIPLVFVILVSMVKQVNHSSYMKTFNAICIACRVMKTFSATGETRRSITSW